MTKGNEVGRRAAAKKDASEAPLWKKQLQLVTITCTANKDKEIKYIVKDLDGRVLEDANVILPAALGYFVNNVSCGILITGLGCVIPTTLPNSFNVSEAVKFVQNGSKNVESKQTNPTNQTRDNTERVYNTTEISETSESSSNAAKEGLSDIATRLLNRIDQKVPDATPIPNQVSFGHGSHKVLVTDETVNMGDPVVGELGVATGRTVSTSPTVSFHKCKVDKFRIGKSTFNALGELLPSTALSPQPTFKEVLDLNLQMVGRFLTIVAIARKYSNRNKK